MARIGLVIRPGISEAVELAEQTRQWCETNNHQIILETHSAEIVPSTFHSLVALSAEQLVTQCDPIITLGGDGTLIGVARYVGAHAPIMVGVNFGNLGFLTEILPNELLATMHNLFQGTTRYATRSILFARVIRSGTEVFSSQAINDAAVLKSVLSPLPSLDLVVNGEEVMRLRGDGLIIATPTGSTAYSLAAGGSIVHPSLEICLVTPVCPHSLTNRPLLLPLDSLIGVRIPPHDGGIHLVMDGQVTFPLQTGDLVEVTRSKNVVKFVRSPQYSYFEILRAKLNWGIANQGER
jgi:NAD+ kinase